MLRVVVIFHHLGVTTLEVNEAIGIGDLLAEKLNHPLSMGLGWVLALEDSLEVFSNHVYGCWR